MELLSIDEIFSGRHLHALCWMLVHSVWQGLLLAVVAGVMISLTRRSPAALRYNLLLGSMLTFLSAAAATYWWHWANYTPLPVLTEASLVEMAAGLPLVQDNSMAGGHFINRLVLFFNEYASLVVLAWLAICLVRVVKIARNLHQLHVLRHTELSAPDKVWSEKLSQFAAALGLRRDVALMLSGIVTVPMVIGHVKPLILIPAGMLCSLPAAEVEAILLHELAHVRRRDYLVNILQHGVELVFFFNLPLMWVSSLIRTERENCCDDIASAFTGDRRTYIHALVGFYEKQVANTAALAWTGPRHQLFERVKRLVHNRNKNLNIMEKLFLSTGIVAAGLLLYAFNTMSPGDSPLQRKTVTDVRTIAASDSRIVLTDTIGKGRHEINATSDEGKKYRVVLQDGEVKEMYVDGVAVPADQREKHMNFVNKLIRDGEEAEEKAASAREEAEEAKERASESRAEADQARQEMKQALKEAEKAAEEAREQADEARQKADRLRGEIQGGTLWKDRGELKEAIDQAQREIKAALNDPKLTVEERKEIQQEIRQAMEEVKKIDVDKMKRDIRSSLKEVENIDTKEIHASIDEAMNSLDNINIQIDDKAINDLVSSALDIANTALKEVSIALQDVNVDLQDSNKNIKRDQKAERRAEKRAARDARKNAD